MGEPAHWRRAARCREDCVYRRETIQGEFATAAFWLDWTSHRDSQGCAIGRTSSTTQTKRWKSSQCTAAVLNIENRGRILSHDPGLEGGHGGGGRDECVACIRLDYA